jgi:hypothetical protein
MVCQHLRDWTLQEGHFGPRPPVTLGLARSGSEMKHSPCSFAQVFGNDSGTLKPDLAEHQMPIAERYFFRAANVEF